MPASRRPGVRIIRSPRDAEAAARDWLIYLGYPDARMTVVGPDEGVDVQSDEVVAQVKSGQSVTGRPVVQQIFGISELVEKEPFLFTVGGVTDEARAWADRAEVAIFQLDLSGNARPLNGHARQVMEEADGTISGWQAVAAELETRLSAGEEVAITAEFRAPGGFHGYWGIWVHSDGSIRVSKDLAGASHRIVHSVREAVEWVASALGQLNATYWDSAPTLVVGGTSRPFRPRITYPVSPDPVSDPAAELGASEVVHPEPVRVTASDIYDLLAGPGCERRVYLEAHGIPGAEPSPLQIMLMELGLEHEDRHRTQFETLADLSEGSFEQRAARTSEALSAQREPIYQGVLTSRYVTSNGSPVMLVGVPDFMIPEEETHRLRDTKTAVRVGAEDRPDITRQLQFYGFLYQRHTGRQPSGLEVVAGDGQLHEVETVGEQAISLLVDRIAELKRAGEEPPCDVKWSDRSSCPYFDHCWSQAVADGQLSIVPAMSRGAVERLRREGVDTLEKLIDRYDEASLADVEVRVGERKRRLGRRADDLLNAARSLVTGEVLVHSRLELLDSESVVLFDLEGTPGLVDDDAYIYLWGTSVIGAEPLQYEPVFASPEREADSQGWFAFLERARQIFETYGDIPWIHWASYERVQIEGHLERFGDRHGLGERVLENLVDLYRIVRDSVTLPVYSYNLKAVEEFVGFERTQAEFGGDWSIATWQEAIETSSKEKRETLLDELAAYNREDLEGMGAVYEYLRGL